MAFNLPLGRFGTPFDRLKILKPLHNVGETHACCQCTGGCRQSIQNVVPTGNFQLAGQSSVGCCQLKRPSAVDPGNVVRLHITLCETKRQYLAIGRQLLPKFGIQVLRRKHSHAICRQAPNHFTIFKGHSFHRGHEFLVLTLRVVHQTNGGLRKTGQHLNLTRVVHAQLHHRTAMFWAQIEQSQWHTNFIVQVALCRQRGACCIGP